MEQILYLTCLPVLSLNSGINSPIILFSNLELMPNWNYNHVCIEVPPKEVEKFLVSTKKNRLMFNMHLLFPERFWPDDLDWDINWDYDWAVENTGTKWFPDYIPVWRRWILLLFFTIRHGSPTSKLLKNSANSEVGPFYLNMKNQVCSLRGLQSSVNEKLYITIEQNIALIVLFVKKSSTIVIWLKMNIEKSFAKFATTKLTNLFLGAFAPFYLF